MQRDEVHKGLLVRLLSEYSNVPTGTWATVDSTGIMRDGGWWFTVKWHPYKPIATKFPRNATEYSLNFWAKDLPLFEIVTVERQEAATREFSGNGLVVVPLDGKPQSSLLHRYTQDVLY